MSGYQIKSAGVSRKNRCSAFSFAEQYDLEARHLLTTAVYAQVGTKIMANSYNVNTQMGRDVAMDANGVTTVVWTDGATWTDGLDGSSFGIYARKLNSSGAPVGSQFRVNQRTEGCQTSPVIGLDGLGNAVIAYSNCDYNPAAMYNNFSNYDVRIQRMNSDNTRGTEIIIPTPNNYTSDPTPQIQVAADGSFTVAYRDGGYLCFRRYGADNTLLNSQSAPIGIRPAEGESEAFPIAPSFKMTPDGTAMAISGIRVKKFIVDVGWKYQDRIAVDKIDSGGVVTRDIVYQSEWEDNSESKKIHGNGPVLSIQPTGDGGYIWFSKVQEGDGILLAEKRNATGVKVNGPITLSNKVSSTGVSTLLPGTSNILLAYSSYTPWVGSTYCARILDSSANPLTEEFLMLENRYGDALKFAFAPGNASRMAVSWNDEHPWLPSGDDSANGVPLVFLEQVTPNSVISFASATTSAKENERYKTVTINRTGELRIGGYSVKVSASSSDLTSTEFTPSDKLVTFAAGETSKTVDVYWADNSIVNPNRHISLKLSDHKGPEVSLGSITETTLEIIDEESLINHAPVIQTIGNKTINAGDILKVQVVATDSDVPAQILTYSLISAPSGAVINSSSGEIQWVAAQASSPANFQVKVTDNGTPALTASTSFSVTVNPVGGTNVAPVVKSISDRIVLAGETLVVQAVATDANAGQTLTYGLMSAPAGATINAQTGEIRWVADQTSSPAIFQVKATDNGTPALSGSTFFKVTVNSASGGANQSPFFQPANDLIVIAGESVVVKMTATDPDPGQSLTYSFLVAPAGATINAQTGEIRWVAVDNPSPYVFQVQVTDNGTPQLSDYTYFEVTVNPVYFNKPVRPLGLSTVSNASANISGLLLRFSGELIASPAANLRNYRVVNAGRDKKFGTRDDRSFAIRSARILPADSSTISITFRTALPKNDDYRLTITGLTEKKTGKLIDGDKNGTNGGAVTAYIRKGITSASIRRSIIS